MIYDNDADLAKLDGKTVAILGYGSQGHAHALNLKESGVDVVVGLREDSELGREGRATASRCFRSRTPPAAGDVVMVLLPDEKQAEIWESDIADGIAPGNLLMFAHGFSIHFGQIEPQPRWTSGWSPPKPGPSGPAPVRGRQRRAGLVADPPGRHRQRARPGARLRQGHRLHARPA